MASPRKTFINPGRFQMMRERFQLEWLRPAPPDRMRRVSDMVPGVVRDMGLEANDPFARLCRAWPALAGSELVRRARPGVLQRGMLLLYVKDPVDAMELRPLLPELLRRIRRGFTEAEVRQVRLMIDPGH